MKNKLAIHSGAKIIKKLHFKKYNTIGKEELKAAREVIKSGVLSDFLGTHSAKFLGGKKVKEFENTCKKYFKKKFVITTNSWTSGLVCAVGALDIEPGDEIIVSPWTMCASATAILHWNAIPIFADINPDTFCIDPDSIKKNISEKTKAILAVDIFGQSCDIKAINKIAKKYKLKVITDSAQAIGSKRGKKLTGTESDIGGFSLNYHKHIHTGEGGILVTDNKNLATRMQLIRNHAEAVVGPMGIKNINNMIGHNFRLGEIESAIGSAQIKKLTNIVKRRQIVAKRLTEGLKNLKGLEVPVISKNNTHVYYMYPLLIKKNIIKKSRKKIFNALISEGIPGLVDSYTNLHLLPMYQKKIAYGKKHFPWSIGRKEITYKKGICPNAENIEDNEFIALMLQEFDFSNSDIDKIISAFKKVWSEIKYL